MDEKITWLRAQLDTVERDAYDVHAIDCAIRNSYPDARIDCDCGWPDRVLRQVQAHRAILTAYDDALSRKQYYDRDGEEEWFRGQSTGYVEAMEDVIKRLVSIYSDRDGYRAEWSV